MHLSVLSDSFLSDSVNDSSWPFVESAGHTRGELHRDGLVRGVIFVIVLATLVGIVAVSGIIRSATIEGGFAPYEAGVPPIGPTARP